LSKKCSVVKDLLPMYKEDLTSEETNQFIEDHVESCKECQDYLEGIEKVLPTDESTGSIDDKSDQQLLNGVKRRMNNLILLSLLVGVFIGSLVFFNLMLSLVVLGIALVFFVIRTKNEGVRGNMNNKSFFITVLIASLFSIIISLKLFFNLGVYADDYGGNVIQASGGWFWLYMRWVNVGLVLLILIFTVKKLIHR
jgi:hypothetical protein